MARLAAISIFILLTLSAYAQQTSYLFASDSTLLGMFVGNEFLTADSSAVMFTTKGNLVFEGQSEDKSDILYLINSKGVFTRNKGYLENNERSKIWLTVKNGSFYYQKAALMNEDELVGVAEENGDNQIVFLDKKNGALLGHMTSNNLTSAQIILAFTQLDGYWGLSQKAKKRIELLREKEALDYDYIGTIEPLNIAGWKNEWAWNGKHLVPKWNGDIYIQWTYDGETVKPYFQGDIQEEYSWDGEYFEPQWRTASEDEWQLNENVLAQTWGNQKFLIEDGYLKDYWSGESVWKINGNMPMPLVILVISGLAYR